MNPGRTLIVCGLVLVVLGLLWSFGSRFGIGRLPGDINIRGERFTVSLPIVTCLLLSILLSAAVWLFKKFFG